MSDLSSRLRAVAYGPGDIAEQAADEIDSKDAEITRLRAENEKLRAALELFACDCIESGNLCPSPQNCRNYIARAALEKNQ